MSDSESKSDVGGSDVVRAVLLIAVACVVYGVMQGVHDNYGIMLNGLVGTSGLTYAQVSFCIGIGAFVYGLAQPFLGMLALRRSNAFVILLGIACMVVGLIATPLVRSFLPMLLFFGLLLPFGTAGLSFGIVMGAITPIIGDRRAAAASGVVQASAGVGDMIMSPALQLMSATLGIRMAMFIITIPFFVMIPVALWLGSQAPEAADAVGEDAPEDERMIPMVREAFRSRDYRLVAAGFATCGFNMSIIESHLFSQFVSYGIPETTASLTLTVYGIFTMIGAVATGALGMRFRMKNVLGSTYLVRVFISLGFLLLPKSVAFAFVATALLGLSGDSTVPPTTGIITKLFGSRKLAVLYGVALVGHQVGAFASASLGGVFVEMGWGYAPLWVLNAVLALFAAIECYRIRVN